MKRQRGRGRKPGGGGGHHQSHGHHQPNRTMESNGPEGKVRGPAALIYERYLQLARDASSSGDRVLAENFFQHADHYFRLLRAMQPAMPPPQERSLNENDYEGDEEGAPENGAAEETEARRAEEQPQAEAAPARQPQLADERTDRPERTEGEFRRRRGRRNRFRPGGEGEEGGPPEGGRGREEEDVAEGFSSSPRPAFLRQD